MASILSREMRQCKINVTHDMYRIGQQQLMNFPIETSISRHCLKFKGHQAAYGICFNEKNC